MLSLFEDWRFLMPQYYATPGSGWRVIVGGGSAGDVNHALKQSLPEHDRINLIRSCSSLLDQKFVGSWEQAGLDVESAEALDTGEDVVGRFLSIGTA